VVLQNANVTDFWAISLLLTKPFVAVLAPSLTLASRNAAGTRVDRELTKFIFKSDNLIANLSSR